MASPHPYVWAPASIARFWENYESSPGMELWHFSRQRGAALLRHVRKRALITDPVLDLGCGSGHLLNLLIAQGHHCFGADVNQKALDMATGRFGAFPHFLGSRLITDSADLPFDDRSMGTVFLLETVEHLLPGHGEQLFAEIRRVLTPGGTLVVTTPWREDLDESMVTCSSCAARFHTTQHIGSFDEAALSAMIENAGMSVVSCRPALLLPDPAVWIRAQRVEGAKTARCPECGTKVPSPNRNLFVRWKGLIKETRHLVGIGTAPDKPSEGQVLP
jgi:SAM-dependent methyltransferase